MVGEIYYFQNNSKRPAMREDEGARGRIKVTLRSNIRTIKQIGAVK